jgi:spore coat protein U-like protein
MKKLSVFLLTFVLILLLAGISFGATATGTLNIGAAVLPTCSVSTTAVNFGNYSGAAVYSNGDITVTCPSGTPYNIALDAGQNSFGNIDGVRAISNGLDRLYYELLKNSGEEWGDFDYALTYGMGTSLADTGNGTAQQHTVLGWLPGPNPFFSPQNPAVVSPGTYTDVVNVTVYY